MCSTVHSGYMNITRRFDALDDWIRSLTISVGKLHQRNTSGRGSSWPCWRGYGGIGCSAGGTGHWSKVLSTAQGRAEVRRCDSTRKLYLEGCVILLTCTHMGGFRGMFMIGTVCILFVSVENAYAYICFVLRWIDRETDRHSIEGGKPGPRLGGFLSEVPTK